MVLKNINSFFELTIPYHGSFEYFSFIVNKNDKIMIKWMNIAVIDTKWKNSACVNDGSLTSADIVLTKAKN